MSYELIRQQLKGELALRLPEFDGWQESDPTMKLLEIAAYREVILRHRVNDARRALLLAYATGGALDQLGVMLRELVPADPKNRTSAVMEADADLRHRLLLAPDSYSVDGPELTYVFHALTNDSDVLDASAIRPSPGEVVVSILSRVGNSSALRALIEMADTWEDYPLMYGTGRIDGHLRIMKLNGEHSDVMAGDLPRKMSSTLNLERAADRSEA